MSNRIAVLFDNLGPYHIARLDALSSVMNLLAIEYRSNSKEYDWNPIGNVPFPRITLTNKACSSQSIKKVKNQLYQTLDEFKPRVLAVPGWSSAFSLQGMNWALSANVPIIMMSASKEIDFARSWWKEGIKKRILSLCDAALVGGEMHREYLIKLGMKGDTIFKGYNVVDNDYFSSQSNKVRLVSEKYRFKKELPEQFFLCTARFIPKKNLLRLLEAYATYLEKYKNTGHNGEPLSLVILGDGEMREKIESVIHKLGLIKKVQLPGFRQIEELPIYYALADAFILPSTTEQWGLVVNEAMASGLPVLISERCGCVSELVKDGVNGYKFDPYKVNEIVKLLTKITICGEGVRSAMGQESQHLISDWSPETFASSMKQASEIALNGNSNRMNWVDKILLNTVARR